MVESKQKDIPAYKPTPVDADDKPYDPEDEDDEVYDPEKELFEEKPAKKKAKSSASRNEPAFSSDESPSPPPPKSKFLRNSCVTLFVLLLRVIVDL